MFISCPCLLTYQFPCDLFVFYRFGDPRVLHSFPTRRSSDLNASQLSDGASACVVMDSKVAERRGLHPLGIFRGFTVAACEPDEMGIGPVFAVPAPLERFNLKVELIDIRGLYEYFTVELRYWDL